MALTQNFPGVYTSVTDNSFQTEIRSRFRAGLIGAAQKGPLNEVVSVRSLRDYVNKFGGAVSDSFLPTACAVLAPLSDGIQVVRVASVYSDPQGQAVSTGVGVAGNGSIALGYGNPFTASYGTNLYVKISQDGKKTTSNVVVEMVGSNTLHFASGETLADTYNAATVEVSTVEGAATEAEALLYGYSLDSALVSGYTGNKGEYTLTLGSVSTAVAAGDFVTITQTGKVSTEYVLVKSVQSPFGQTVLSLETSAVASTGYQPMPLQDTYTNASIKTFLAIAPLAKVTALTPGEWANSNGTTSGVIVNVARGTTAGTSRINVLYGGNIVEAFDNVTPNNAEAKINTFSSYIEITVSETDYSFLPTFNGYATDTYTTLGLPTKTAFVSDAEALNVAALTGGANGSTLSDADYIGTYDPVTDLATGLKLFADPETVDVDVICAPGVTSIAVAQEGVRVARENNALYLIDIPRENENSIRITPALSVDWHNGAGIFTNEFGKIDSSYGAIYFNWFRMTNPLTGVVEEVPPTIGTLRCLAYTADTFQPWYAAAGEIRGAIPEALSLDFPRISSEIKDSMYGNGNSVNPIILSRNNIRLYGQRTLQRTESKLTAVNNMILTNTIVKALAVLARQFVFDPNDSILLGQYRSVANSYLAGIRDARGIEAYELVVDETNNTAETRNRREMIVDVSFIPVDAAERIFINATVRESGAVLVNSVT